MLSEQEARQNRLVSVANKNGTPHDDAVSLTSVPVLPSPAPQRKLVLIGKIARAMRQNDLAAAGVARVKEQQYEVRRRIEAKHARAEAAKRAIDAARLDRVRDHLARISAACTKHKDLRKMRLLVAEHEAQATLEMYRPPPIFVPGDAFKPHVVYTPRHDEVARESERFEDEEEEDEPFNGYNPDEESGHLSPIPRRKMMDNNRYTPDEYFSPVPRRKANNKTPLPGRGTRPLRKGLTLLATRVAERVTPSRSRPSRKGITAVPLELEAYHC